MEVIFRRKNGQTKILKIEEELDYYIVPELIFTDPRAVDLFLANTNELTISFKKTTFSYPHFNIKPWIEYIEE
jgi:hypothetical protein